MGKDADIYKSFNETLKKSELNEITIDITEAGLDSLLSEGVLKELPVLKTFYSFIQIGLNIKDWLFLKKIVTFLYSLKDVPAIQREKMIADIDSSDKYKVQAGEKLLYVIDYCKDHEASRLVGLLFKAYLEEKITYKEFVSASETVSTMPTKELEGFLSYMKNHEKDKYIFLDDVSEYLHYGLFYINYEPPEVTVNENDDYKSLLEGGSKYVTDVHGGDMGATLSSTAKTIFRVLA